MTTTVDTARGAAEAHLRAAEAALRGLDPWLGVLCGWASVLHRVLSEGGLLLAAGNGGSAAHAQHLTSELVGRFCRERRPFPAICLSAESSALTAIGNDYGYDEVFSRQVQAYGREGDVLVLFSTSGRSPNLVRAAQTASTGGLTTLALTGPAPNRLADACTGAVTVDAATMAAVQDAHQSAVHALCAAFDHLYLDQEAPP
jgi:D-sedoheptulose 7-phosphate isomerase